MTTPPQPSPQGRGRSPLSPLRGDERRCDKQYAIYEPYKYYDPFVEGSY